MRVRLATAADVPAIEALVAAAFAVYIPRIGRRPAPMDDDQAAHVRAGHTHVTATADGHGITGAIVLVPAADHLLVDTVAVAAGYQHQGIGRALLAHAETVARAAGHDELRLYTNAKMTENRSLYPRLGYAELGRATSAQGFARVHFGKRLSGGGPGR